MTSTHTLSSYVIFVDGASSGNPGPGGWGAIVVTPDSRVVEMGGKQFATTNNQMELTAAIQALLLIEKASNPIQVYSDSAYVIRGITQWIYGWRKKGWVTAEGKPVANSELWIQLSNAVGRKKVFWNYVRGHSGIPGNERADEIAVGFSRGTMPSLYHGPLDHYTVPILEIPEDTDLPPNAARKQESAKGKATSTHYLSLVNGVPMRHATWTECENRVKGRSGAKFKKVLTATEETETLKRWGVTEVRINQKN